VAAEYTLIATSAAMGSVGLVVKVSASQPWDHGFEPWHHYLLVPGIGLDSD
jgi:hypothetical protein